MVNLKSKKIDLRKVVKKGSEISVKMNLAKDMDECELKALQSLSRYKFMMFGYWCAMWVHLNKISGLKKPNPFRCLVELANERALELQIQREKDK